MTAKLRLRRRKHIIFKESESPDTQSTAARKHYPHTAFPCAALRETAAAQSWCEFCSTTSYMHEASALSACSSTFVTRTVSSRCPNETVITSPTLTSYDALTGLPLTVMRDASHASLATVLRFIIRETFKNLFILLSLQGIHGNLVIVCYAVRST